mgnify:CR=1 FL=1
MVKDGRFYAGLSLPLSLSCDHRVVDGGTMAVGQAVGAFEHFTGLAADPARMERHFRRLIAERA